MLFPVSVFPSCSQFSETCKSFPLFLCLLHHIMSPPLGYEVPVLSQYLDWIAVMTYDYHGQWDKKTGHVSPMYAHPQDDNLAFNTVSTSILYPTCICGQTRAKI